MPSPVGLFLEFEAKLYLDLLFNPITKFSFALEAYNLAVQNQTPLTVDQFRISAGLPPHPDTVKLMLGSSLPEEISAVYPEGRGNQFVYKENVTSPSDSVIPPELLVSAWNNLWLTLSKIEQGGPSREQVSLQYSKLFTAASQAAKDLGVELA